MPVRKLYIFSVLFILLITGCQEHVPTTVATVHPTRQVVSTRSPSPIEQIASKTHPPLPMASKTPTETTRPTITPTYTPTVTPTIHPATQLTLQCLEVLPEMPVGAISNGKVILSGTSREITHTVLLDMTTRQGINLDGQGENSGEFTVSANHDNLAFRISSLDPEKKAIQHILVIASADGQRQKIIPWDEKWLSLLGWTNDNRLLLSYDDPTLIASGKLTTLFAYLVLDPFSGEQEIHLPDAPGHIHDTKIPDWNGWWGVLYDPTLTRFIYPKVIEDNENYFTFALMDMTTNSLIARFDDIYHELISLSVAASMPVWFADGAQFVFIGNGGDMTQPEFELYQAKNDGQVEQLTHLSSIAFLRGMNFNWSPDGKKIAMYINTLGNIHVSYVSVLDLETKDIVNYCIPVRRGGFKENYPPIWSPDSQQFLVMDWPVATQSRVILVDINQAYAAEIAHDMEPVGWLVAP